MKKMMFMVALMCCIVPASAQLFKNATRSTRPLRNVEYLAGRNPTIKLDSVTSEWFKYLCEYDARLNCVLRTECYLESDGWDVDCTYAYTYDELDRMTSILYTRSISMEKTEYIYNEQGLLSEETQSYNYFYEDSIWHFRHKYTYGYDDDGNRILSVKYRYIDDNWTENEKKVWEYEDGLIQSMMFYQYSEGQWYPFEKSEYRYNEQGLCEELSVSNNYIQSGEWDEYYKELYEYDGSGNLVSRISLQKSFGMDTLEYEEKVEFEYDENNNCIYFGVYYYHSNDGSWSLEGWYDLAYDPTTGIEDIAGLSMFWEVLMEENDVDIPVFSKLQHVTLTLEDDDVYELNCYYSAFDNVIELSGNEVSIWPNPASEMIHIEGVESAEVRVYNALGQWMTTLSGTNDINVSGWAEGMYLLRVADREGKVSTGRLTVRR
ncbi:MAG: T9SS type A sorting domain-containing protein [Bacteroidales bacterium]|nr:T9SS type A sorting domain-containing protein [Bacteroidales bacterium]